MSRVQPVPDDEHRRDLIALRERGVTVTQGVRTLLWLAIDWHDITRDLWAAQIVLSSRPGDELRALREAMRKWADDATSLAAKAEANAYHQQARDKAFATGKPLPAGTNAR